jgi:hypothetical protein
MQDREFGFCAAVARLLTVRHSGATDTTDTVGKKGSVGKKGLGIDSVKTSPDPFSTAFFPVTRCESGDYAAVVVGNHIIPCKVESAG